MEAKTGIALLIILGLTILFTRRSRRKKSPLVRRHSEETHDEVMDTLHKRTPAKGPCTICRKPRCPSKNDPDGHYEVKHENKARHYEREGKLGRGRKRR
jgi:hypothetical protein